MIIIIKIMTFFLVIPQYLKDFHNVDIETSLPVFLVISPTISSK